MTNKTKRGLSAFLLILCCGIALLLTLAPGETEKKATSVDYDPAEVWDAEMSDRFSQILLDQVAVKKKEYKIPDSAVSAPLPDESCYGEAQSAAELQWLVDKAADILEGQPLYFSTDIEIFPDSTIHYYLDETLLVITWKQVISHTVFTFSEVKLMHPSQFRRRVRFAQQLEPVGVVLRQHVAVPARQHDRQGRPALAHLAPELDTTKPWHDDVGEHHVEGGALFFEKLERLSGVRCKTSQVA